MNPDKLVNVEVLVLEAAGAEPKRRKDLAGRLDRGRRSRAEAQGFPANMGELGVSSEIAGNRMRPA
jgi:hypothetical protein